MIKRKKNAVLNTTGKLACEVCSFDFAAVYGEVGVGFAEAHHKRPLSDVGQSATRLSDLAVVCSNCHRMLHRGKPWLTLSELAERLPKAGSRES